MITRWAQRWKRQRGVYRPRGEPIRRSEYDVDVVPDDTTARTFIREHHSMTSVIDCVWFDPELREPIVVAYGMGVDSTALLVGLARRGIVPDLILFADTGGEKPETYAYLPIIQAWLARVSFPPVIVVRRAPISGQNGDYDTLEGNCLVNATLPGLAFGRKSCSMKWKVEPQNSHCASWAPAIACWARGRKVQKLIGYDAGPKDKRRRHIPDDARYRYFYPLDDWGWDRERCEREILAEGLPLPPKSACWFCPATKPEELVELRQKHPWIPGRLRAIEMRAAPNLRSIAGLWGRPTARRPGSMTEFLNCLDAGVPWTAPARERASAAKCAGANERARDTSPAEPTTSADLRSEAARKAWRTRRQRAAAQEGPRSAELVEATAAIPVPKIDPERSAAARRAWDTRRAKEARAA